MARIIKTTGEIIEVTPKNGKDFKGDELHEMVDGYIEPLSLDNGEIMIVDEEGLLKDKDYNEIASGIAGGTIVGDVVIISKNQIK